MLSHPLLRSQLYRPPLRARPVRRARLTARLEAALHAPLALLSAPPGFGKTSLLVEWLEGLRIASAWLALDA